MDHSPPPKGHIAVCAFPFGTHAGPLLMLVKQMASEARDVRFTFFNTEASNATLFKPANEKCSAFRNIVPCNVIMTDVPMPPPKAMDTYLELAPKRYKEVIEEVERESGVEVSCVIGDAFLWFCGEIAEEKGVTWFPLWTASVASLSVHLHTDLLRERFGRLIQGGCSFEDELIDCIPGFSSARIRDLPGGVVTGDFDAPFNKMLHKMASNLPKATAVVVNSFEGLLPIITNDLKSKLRLLSVGPFTLASSLQPEPDNCGCLEWLNSHEAASVAYISFGSYGTPPNEEIVALAEGLVASQTPFLWSMKEPCKASLPASLVEKIIENEKLGKIVPWAPQMKVLSHSSIGVFITHCGWNSIMEAIVSGVPLICRPLQADQWLNKNFIEQVLKFGVGVEDEKFTKIGSIKVMHQVLSSEEGKQLRTNVNGLKELAEQCIKPGGSSSEDFKALMKLAIGPKETNYKVENSRSSNVL